MPIRILDWITGEWYLAMRCHVCGWQFAFSYDNGDLPADCPIEITCIECRQTGNYCPKEFQRVQAG